MILLILNIIKNLFNIMHKSILFLLICSLIMLLSFGSSISILSNSLAIEEGMNSHMNNQDSSQIYEKFYKDDSFRETYYNYHKQHHHQQEQQQQQQNQESRYNDNHDDMKNHLITITTTMMINPKIMSLERKLNIIISM